MQSTRTTDPTDALIFKREFPELKQQEDPDEKLEDLGKLALGAAAEKYFEWKSANCSDKTIARERRMFKGVLKFFGKTKIVRSTPEKHGAGLARTTTCAHSAENCEIDCVWLVGQPEVCQKRAYGKP